MNLLLLSAAFTSCRNSQDAPVAPLEVRWEMGQNLEDRTYSNSFVLINRSGKTLEKDWTIWYSQLPRSIFQDSLAPVKIETVNGDFFRMYSSESFEGLQPGDSIRISFRANNGLIKETHAPAGMYITFMTGDKESTPVSLPVTVVPFTNPNQWTRPYAKEAPYPDGNRMYAVNNRIAQQDVDATDMIPSVKKVEVGSEMMIIPKRIAVSGATEFNNEAQLLSEKLTSAYGAQVDNDATFRISLDRLPENTNTPNDEYYQLKADKAGIRIEAATAHGIFNGTQTLLGLLKDKSLPDTIQAVSVTDYPDMLYRGMMLDVARNFVGKEHIIELIDLFATYKINALHLHLTDDEGWRLEIPGIEELTTVGAFRGHTHDEASFLYPSYGSGPSATDLRSAGNGFYSRQDYIDILKYAAARHIRVVPEVDLPGHSRAAIVAMKARYNKYIATDSVRAAEYLLTDFNDKSVYHSVQDYTDNVVSVALPSTYRFIDKIVGEIKAMYTEAGAPLEQLHIGGDEVPHGAWSDAALCRELMSRENITEVQALNGYFFNRANQILKSHGLKAAGWQELAFSSGEKVADGNKSGFGSLYCWNTGEARGADMIPYTLANAGYDVILSNVNNLYFDLAYNRHQSEPGLHWGGYVDEVSSFNVLPYSVYASTRYDALGNPRDLAKAGQGKVALSAAGRERIKGVQGQLWSETVTSYPHTQYMIFPKLFGLAERGWNAMPAWSMMPYGTKAEEAYLKDLSAYYNTVTRRELPYLSALGVNYHVNQPGILLSGNELRFNTVDPNAEVYYTLDGTTPTTASARWDGAPVTITQSEPQVRAIAVVRGKQSVVTRL